MLRKIARVFLAAFLSIAILIGSAVSNNFGLGETLVLTPSTSTPGWNFSGYFGSLSTFGTHIVLRVRQSTPPVLVAEYLSYSDWFQTQRDINTVPRAQQGTPLIGPPLVTRNTEGLYQIALAFFLVAHQNFLPDIGAKWQAWSQGEDLLFPPLEARIRKQVEPSANVRKRHPSYYSHRA